MRRAHVVVVGSGAGGATTALELARAGLEVTVLEEGPDISVEEESTMEPGSIEQLRRMYRKRGMTPLRGNVPIPFVEGCCVGGSTQINSGFWHRLNPEILLQWRQKFRLVDIEVEELSEHFLWAEDLLRVGKDAGTLPASSMILKQGADVLGWQAEQVPRTGALLPGRSNAGSGAGGKRMGYGVKHALLNLARQSGATILSQCKASKLLARSNRITSVSIVRSDRNGVTSEEEIRSDFVFVCGGPTQTPLLLRRSGIEKNVGNTLKIHPMLKVTALFPFEIDAGNSHLPLVQIKQFQPDLSMGGAFFSTGHLAMLLAPNWEINFEHMQDYDRIASYYVAVRGTGKGRVRADDFRYELSKEDIVGLSRGLSNLSLLLLEAGATKVLPAIAGQTAIESKRQVQERLSEIISVDSLNLSTVHAFSSCPIGEERKICAADSYGKVNGFENLYIGDASMLPDSPGLNPQGTIMAIARRNVLRFLGSL